MAETPQSAVLDLLVRTIDEMVQFLDSGKETPALSSHHFIPSVA